MKLLHRFYCWKVEIFYSCRVYTKSFLHQSYFTSIYIHAHVLHNFQTSVSTWPSKYLLLIPFLQKASLSLLKGTLHFSSTFAGGHSLSSCYVNFLLKFKSLWQISVPNSLMASCLRGKANVSMYIVFKFGSVPGSPG